MAGKEQERASRKRLKVVVISGSARRKHEVMLALVDRHPAYLDENGIRDQVWWINPRYAWLADENEDWSWVNQYIGELIEKLQKMIDARKQAKVGAA